MNYYRHTFIFLLLFFSFNLYSQSIKITPQCQLVRNGLFFFENDEGIPFYVTRNGDYETHVSFDGTIFFTYKIEWTSNCEYKMTLLSGNASYEHPISIRVVITEVNKLEYVYKQYEIFLGNETEMLLNYTFTMNYISLRKISE